MLLFLQENACGIPLTKVLFFLKEKKEKNQREVCEFEEFCADFGS